MATAPEAYLPGDPNQPNVVTVQTPYSGATYYVSNNQAPVSYWEPVLIGGAAIILLLVLLERS